MKQCLFEHRRSSISINAMGISKAMMEKVIVAKSRNVNKDKTIIVPLDMVM